MICPSKELYDGFALYCRNNKPIGVVSQNGDRKIICNTSLIPKKLKKYIVEIEDKRFYEHGAIDLKGITRAIYQNMKAGKIVQGGSTITQQLARNILRDNNKSLLRKLKETRLAFNLEKRHSKDAILNLYFDEVFWGKKNYGLRAASLDYFLKEPEHLSTKEQLALVTLLRGPNFYIKNEKLLKNRCEFLSKLLYKRNVLTEKKFNSLSRNKFKIQDNNLGVYRNITVPFISTRIIESKHTVITTLSKELQVEVTRFINNSQYPTSVIGISNGEVVCLGSSNGTDYPFTFKSNVGSTLKPFIYNILRTGGYKAQDLFQTTIDNDIGWQIKEAHCVNSKYLTLEEALIISNNAVFVNAVFNFGIDKALLPLSKIINKPLAKLVPASILGATTEGLSLYELVMIYNDFFYNYKEDPIKVESVAILRKIALEKFKGEFTNSFLKTGTTNFNKERFAILGYANMFFGFLRQGNEHDDSSKEGGFISSILNFLTNISKKVYKW